MDIQKAIIDILRDYKTNSAWDESAKPWAEKILQLLPKEKAGVLTESEIDKIIGSESKERYLARHCTNAEAIALLTAQRDHDHIHYTEGK